jgi:putative ATP-dependent endonuclease of OLD family
LEISSPSADVFIVARHPTADGVAGLLELKEKELQKIVKDKGLTAQLKGNPGMRKAIWEAEADLRLADDVGIPVSKPKEDSKRISEQIDILAVPSYRVEIVP